MSVSNQKLIDGLETGMTLVGSTTSDAEKQEAMSCLKIILDELRLRGDEGRLQALVNDGVKVVSDALSEVGNSSLEGQVAQFSQSLPDYISWEVYAIKIEELLALAERVSLEIKSQQQGESGFMGRIQRIIDWEISVHEYIGVKELAVSKKQVITQERVRDFIRSQSEDYHDAEITEFSPLAGGFSKETIIIDVKTQAHGKEELILRGEGAVKLLNIKGQNVEKEFWLLKYINGSDIKVAEAMWLDNSMSPKYFISRRMPGECKGAHIGKNEPLSNKMLESLAVELSKIHQINLDFSDMALKRSHIERVIPNTCKAAVENALREWTDYWVESIGRKSPLIMTAIEWVYENIPENNVSPVLVHGDCGLNNLLVENDEISAVLDWEISHLGDPNEDISWALYGMADEDNRQFFVDKYIELGGNEIDEFSLKFYEVIAALKILHALYEAQERYVDAEAPEIKLCKLGFPFLADSLKKLQNDLQQADQLKSSLSQNS